MEKIKEILMRRDGMMEEDALNLIEEAKIELVSYIEEWDTESAFNICEEFFGLEPDYIYAIM